MIETFILVFQHEEWLMEDDPCSTRLVHEILGQTDHVVDDDDQGRINHSGAPYQHKAGPFSHTRTQDFLSRGALFFSQEVDDLL